MTIDWLSRKARKAAKKGKARFWYRDSADRLVIAVSHKDGSWFAWETTVRRRKDGCERLRAGAR